VHDPTDAAEARLTEPEDHMHRVSVQASRGLDASDPCGPGVPEEDTPTGGFI
jgi:hypothetical protein